MIKLSIIIPTHNRAKCAIETVASILELLEDVQVVVCDSSDEDFLSHHFLGESFASKVKYVRTAKSISVVDNFNLGLRSADGEYLVFLGDDDFVSREIMDVVNWASEHAVDSVKFNFPALYYWRDFYHATRGDVYSGTLHVGEYTGSVSLYDAKKSVVPALNNFGGGVFCMPRAYAGMISSSLAKKIVDKHGALFGGVSPDIYSSFLISIESEKCVLVDYPVIVPGASGLSTTGQSNSGAHYGKLRENPHISAFQNLVWDKKIPEFYSVPTVWSYSLLKAVEKVQENNPKFQGTPNFGRLFLKCFIYFPSSSSETRYALREAFRSFGRVRVVSQLMVAVGSEFYWGMSRIVTRLKSRYIKKSISVIDSLDTSLDGSRALKKYLHEHPVKLKLPSL